MMVRGKSSLAFGFLVATCAVVSAQLPEVNLQPVRTAVQGETFLGNQSDTDVPGAPFSAIEESLYCEKQADGSCKGLSSITTHFYRDAQGRTRAERSTAPYVDGKAQPAVLRSITLVDPLAGTVTRLDTSNRKAFRGPTEKGLQIISSPAIMPKSDGASDELQPSRTTESLGTATMEGLVVEGTRQTLEIPAGASGNEKSIDVTVETWVSPELKAAILTKRETNGSRERITRLTHVELAEPDPALFQIPADYKIEDEPAAAPVVITNILPHIASTCCQQ
jgi:hypothetical protein